MRHSLHIALCNAIGKVGDDPPQRSERVDTGAWIALVLTRDPLHERAKAAWSDLQGVGAKLRTSIPIVLETFTFLERNSRPDVAIAWQRSLEGVPRLRLLECTRADLNRRWKYFERRDLHKLSAIDATTFAIMQREQISTAFAFDHHFASVGFKMVG